MPSAPQNDTPASTQAPSSDETHLRESLKRCSAATVEAAVAYRQRKDPALISTVVLGIFERFLDPAAAQKLKEPDDDLRVMEDLGLDSLTLMEAVILIEEVVQISINNDELRNLRTIGDIRVFIDHKVRGLPPPEPSKVLPIEEIAAAVPQQHPFLFLQEATLSSGWATGAYTISGQEAFLAGHFKDNPIFPASILLEALGQLAVLFMLRAPNTQLESAVDPKTILFTGCESVRCHRVCRPGDVLRLSVKPKRLRMPIATFEGQIRVGQEKAVVAEDISLTFGFALQNDEPAGPRA
ncbi:MAG: phosphopantetheine-binding protein [Opitutaceae bacterium]